MLKQLLIVPFLALTLFACETNDITIEEPEPPAVEATVPGDDMEIKGETAPWKKGLEFCERPEGQGSELCD